MKAESILDVGSCLFKGKKQKKLLFGEQRKFHSKFLNAYRTNGN